MPCQACFVSSSTRHAACVHAGGVSVRSPRAHAALQSKPTRGQDVSSRAHGTSSTSHPPRQDKQDLWVARLWFHVARGKLVRAGSGLSTRQHLLSRNELCKSNCCLSSSSLTGSGRTGNIYQGDENARDQADCGGCSLSLRAGLLGAVGREHQKTWRQQNLFSITARSVPQHVGAEISDQRHMHLSGLCTNFF